MIGTPLRELLRQALEADCDLEEVQEMVQRDGGATVPDDLAAIIAGGDRDLAILAAGASRVVPWEAMKPALLRLDREALGSPARTLITMCFVDNNEEPPFMLTRGDVISGVRFGHGAEDGAEDLLEDLLEDVGATPEEIEEVLGNLVRDADEWGRPSAESAPLSSFRSILADELAVLPSVQRGAHLDTAYLLDDYLDGWTDCGGAEEITVNDLLGFAGWYLIAHTSASPASITEHLSRLPRLLAVIDKHFDTHLGSGWAEEADAIATDVTRVLELAEATAHGLGAASAGIERAEEGHWEFLGARSGGAAVRRLEDGREIAPVALPEPAMALVRVGDVLNLLIAPAGEWWNPVDAGPAYPARVGPFFHRARAAAKS